MVFGGTGFIGRAISEYLITKGASRVLLLDIGPPTKPLLEEEHFVECDVRMPIDVQFDDVDLIVNLAAVHRTPGHPDHEYHETNEQGATNVTSFASRIGCLRIWFTSSIAVYGPGEDSKTEASTPHPVSAYGKSKLQAERIHREWADADPSRRLVIARPATVFGSGEGGNFTRLAKTMKRRAFVYPGRRDTLKACGYVKDLPRAFAFMEPEVEGTVLFNFAYPEPPTIEDVCTAFARVADLPAPRLKVPAPVLVKTGAILESAGVSSFNPERVKKLMLSTNVHGSALQDAGFEFKFSLDDGLQDWFSQSPENQFN